MQTQETARFAAMMTRSADLKRRIAVELADPVIAVVDACTHTFGGFSEAAIAAATAFTESTRDSSISRRFRSVYRQFADKEELARQLGTINYEVLRASLLESAGGWSGRAGPQDCSFRPKRTGRSPVRLQIPNPCS